MDYLKEWAVMLCTASVLSGIIVYIIPDGKMKKTADIVISLFMLAVFVSLFTHVDLTFENFDPDKEIETEISSEEFNDYLISQSKITSEKLIESELCEICHFPYSINTSWEMTANEISLTAVDICINRADSAKTSKIKTKIGALTGIIPEVTAE